MIVRVDDIGRFADHHCSNFHSIKNYNKHQKKTQISYVNSSLNRNWSRTKDHLK